jgi:uncharacterized membrane protein
MMSLRAFHLFFIAVSVALCAFFSSWAVGQYRLEHELPYALLTVGCVLSAVGLAAYGVAFQRKMRRLLS